MIIGIDAHREHGGILRGPSVYARLIRRYLTRELIRRGHRVILFSRVPLSDGEGATTVVVSPSHPWLVWFPAVLVRQSVDHLFIPASDFPFGSRVPFTVLVHDLGYETHPALYARGERLQLLLRMRRSMRHAARLIVPSHATFEVLTRLFPSYRDKTFVVPHGVEYNHFAAPNYTIASEAQVVSRIPSGRPLIAVLGVVDAKKNSLAILKAFARFKAMTNSQAILLFMGWRGFGAGVVEKEARLPFLKDSVLFTPAIGYDELPLVYRKLSLLVYTTLVEGFGLPILEAFAAGTPVLTSNRNPHQEVAGNAASCVDPANIDAIAGSIARILADDDYRARLVSAGRVRARDYTWETSARRTASVLTNEPL
ncbi:MAG: glycosyltransferase family 4 protein [Parcubacteria group bacterium]|nr:glycosyltransferase family 4 protein [Parcubacteria group bacterium]